MFMSRGFEFDCIFAIPLRENRLLPWSFTFYLNVLILLISEAAEAACWRGMFQRLVLPPHAPFLAARR